MEIVRFNARATVNWELHRGQRCWVGICDPLSLTVEAETIEELNKLIAHSMDLFFRDLLSKGELPQFLLANGWRPVHPIPKEIPHEGIKFDIPFDLHEPSCENAHC